MSNISRSHLALLVGLMASCDPGVADLYGREANRVARKAAKAKAQIDRKPKTKKARTGQRQQPRRKNR